MTLLSSLRSRIFLTSALLAVLSIGVAIYLVNATVTREAEQPLQREIEATGPSSSSSARRRRRPSR